MPFPGSGEGGREEAGLWDTTDFDGRREELLGRMQGLDALRRTALVPVECDAAASGDERLRGSKFNEPRREEVLGCKVEVELFRDMRVAEREEDIVSGEGPREETDLRFGVR